MRTRSEAAAGAGQTPLAGQQAMFPICGTCGLKQSAKMVAENQGMCIKGHPFAEKASVEERALSEKTGAISPEELATEVARLATQAVKPRTRSEALAAAVGGSPVLPGEPDPWQLKPESVTPATPVRTRSQALAEAKPLSTEEEFPILAKLIQQGGVPVTLPFVAKMTPEQREECRKWAVAGWKPYGLPEVLKLFQGNPSQAPQSQVTAPAAHPKVEVAKAGVTPPQSQVTNVVNHGPKRASGWDAARMTAGDAVKFVWAKETYTPVPGSYSSIDVGPFEAATTIREGEAYGDAYVRLATQVNEMAELERDRKINSFVKKLRQAVAEAKS